ncbi:hypothetical protein DVH24_014805 [Malus domestica]|uniref:Leucine-rich repeat-containing N-terminal plant-type domain-containing protein n=1 Tax=Malus domestica TaxID=3750 RepID=A0A498K1Y5_MALDO|nr:hypothetical protein DVH24_014805 [Malus domestica]
MLFGGLNVCIEILVHFHLSLPKTKTLFHYLILFFLIVVPLHSRCIEDEQSALLHFKKRILFNSSTSIKLISWNSSSDCCSWDGVTCSTKGACCQP